MTPPPRVRIAPSPTGYFHVGTGRTALFNWLFARQTGGTFVLRIEDTDAARNRPEHTEGIMRAMSWLGLDWDEGPYFQSQRSELYQSAIQKLVDGGFVYACDCTPEQIQARAKERGGPPGYDGFCRERGLELTAGRLLRFRTPREGETYFADLVRDSKPIQNGSIEDFGVRKSSGDPLFILANVVDDADMAITHVIRGEDHFTNTTKYVLLWEALGYGPAPTFAHLPLILNDQRKKLSKRRDKVAVEDYRDDGYLPEAMVNYLALLGWSPGADREIVSREEMIAEFRLEDVKSAGAIFDERKLQAVNAEYLRALAPEEFVARSQAWLLDRWGPIAVLVQERSRTLGEVYTLTDFLYRADPVIDAEEWDKGVRKNPAFAAILTATVARYAAIDWDAGSIQEATVAAGSEAGVEQLGKAQAPVRLAVTGRSVGPPLWESLELLGRDRTVARLQAALLRLQGGPLSM
ncbi:MAG TPA: glutamate--tRNA ligase [Acidimicrobiales bacterium]|nr:glutamate--tRNA ligase [Acidimicrobiales bacterium]